MLYTERPSSFAHIFRRKPVRGVLNIMYLAAFNIIFLIGIHEKQSAGARGP